MKRSQRLAQRVSVACFIAAMAGFAWVMQLDLAPDSPASGVAPAPSGVAMPRRPPAVTPAQSRASGATQQAPSFSDPASRKIEELRQRCGQAMRVETPAAERDAAACQRYADATRGAYPAPPVPTRAPATTAARRPAGAPKASPPPLHRKISVPDCHRQHVHGSVADRECRQRTKRWLESSCREYRQKWDAASGERRQTLRGWMNGYCFEAGRYSVID